MSDCKNIPCCQNNPFEYSISTADTVSCFPVPDVLFNPPPGSYVIFPTFVAITSNRPDAVIRYTTDGTDVTDTSTIYTAPIQLLGPSDTIRAKAFVGGCNGLQRFATYLVYDDSLIVEFTRLCDTVPFTFDQSGVWGVFDPDMLADYCWRLYIYSGGANLEPQSITVFQTDSNGTWNTGQAWSTQEYINPPEGPPNFHVFPLVMIRQPFAVRYNDHAYSDNFSTDYGPFLAATDYDFRCFGQIQHLVQFVSYFKLVITLIDGTVITRLIAFDCTGDPPPCMDFPAIPTATPYCNRIDIQFNATFGTLARLMKMVGTTPTQLGANRVPGTGPWTQTDVGVSKGTVYQYWVEVVNPPCPVAKSGILTSQLIPIDAVLSVTPQVPIVPIDSGDTVDYDYTVTIASPPIDQLICVEWTGGSPGTQCALYVNGVPGSILNIGPLTPDESNECTLRFYILDNVGCVAEAFFTYEFNASCDDTMAPYSVQVVSSTAEGDYVVRFLDLQRLLCEAVNDFPTGACTNPTEGFDPPIQTVWNGQLINPYAGTPGSCSWETPANERTLCVCGGGVACDTSDMTHSGYTFRNYGHLITYCWFDVDRWRLAMTLGNTGSGPFALWAGEKLTGPQPYGTYTQTAGCITTIPTMDVIP